MIVSISAAKANFSKLVNMAYHGEKITITKNDLPLVDLVVHKPEGKRTLGLLEGKIDIPDNFTDEDADIEEMFYGQSL